MLLLNVHSLFVLTVHRKVLVKFILVVQYYCVSLLRPSTTGLMGMTGRQEGHLRACEKTE